MLLFSVSSIFRIFDFTLRVMFAQRFLCFYYTAFTLFCTVGAFQFCEIRPFPFLPQPYDFPDGGIANDSFTKGVVLAPDILLIGVNLCYGNYPSLNNSAWRQHSVLSPLDCLSAKADGAVNGGAKQRSFYC